MNLWIGLAIVAATVFVVVFAMNFHTAEKHLQHRVRHRYPIADPQFRREMSAILGPAIIPGNIVQELHNGEEIFPAMLKAIREAQKTITFETYIYWSGDIGKKVSDALCERAQAGVQVNVTLDWAGSSKMDNELLETMKKCGVQVHRYRPLHWYNLGRLNNRTHRKLLTIDGRIGFTGGVGIADQWDGRAQDPEHWRDVHFRIEGPVVAQVQAAFNDNWIKTTGELLHGPDYFPELEKVGELDAHLFLSSPSGGSESMHLMFLMAIAAAEKTIDLTAAYFVPDKLMTRAIEAACVRGVKVRVLLPGKHIDSTTVHFSSKAIWGELLRVGVLIHEYEPTMLHTKLLVVDGEMVSVGSTNFDIRSFRLNDEASLNVYDVAFAARMTEVFEKDLQRAKLITYEMWKNRPLYQKVMEKVLRPIKSQI